MIAPKLIGESFSFVFLGPEIYWRCPIGFASMDAKEQMPEWTSDPLNTASSPLSAPLGLFFQPPKDSWSEVRIEEEDSLGCIIKEQPTDSSSPFLPLPSSFFLSRPDANFGQKWEVPFRFPVKKGRRAGKVVTYSPFPIKFMGEAAVAKRRRQLFPFPVFQLCVFAKKNSFSHR